MNINDYLNAEIIAQSINRFEPMNFKKLKRVTEHYADEEMYGLAGSSSRVLNDKKVIYDIWFKRSEDSKVLTMHKDYFTILGVSAACVMISNQPESRLTRIKPADITVYGRDVEDMANQYGLRVKMLEAGTTQRFIPLYVPKKTIPIPSMIV